MDLHAPANDVGGDLVDAAARARTRASRSPTSPACIAGGAAVGKFRQRFARSPRARPRSAISPRRRTTSCRDGLPNRFATLIYLDVREQSGTVRLMNAGHMPPAHLSGSTYHELPRGNMALGLMDGATYEEQVVELKPGDMLVVYSDGLTEALNDTGEFYGEERLQALYPTLTALSAKDAGARLLASADAFIGETKPYDDLSLVILKRT